MPHIGTIRFIVSHIFRQRLLRSLLLIGLVIPIFILLRSYLLVLPQFSDKLLAYSEEEAEKTAGHISINFITLDQDQIVVNDTLKNDIHKLTAQFGLEKIKLFADNGRILFSTEEQEIGKINEHDYFHQVVAKGQNFSKIVTKDSKTLEGKVSNRDVAEIYIPIMRENRFIGAFELYYDLSKRKGELDALFRREALVGVAISLVMIGIVSIMVFQTSRAMLEEKEAEDQLKAINANLEEIVAEKTRELQATQETSIESLAILAEYHDIDTGEHLNRIRCYTELLATTLLEDSPYSSYLHGQGKETYVQELVLASTLHDIGKTAIAKEILCKPAKLTSKEFDEVKNHTIIAWDALNRGNEIFVERFGKDSYLALAGNIALYHHEKWDGSGYPSRIQGETIPLSARIVALADVYDALRSKRPYKDPWSHEETVELIRSESGKHFDPVIVEVFLRNKEEFREISTGLGKHRG
jgi:response regulator RpfG family c-di-GMP phosphodiesterase